MLTVGPTMTATNPLLVTGFFGDSSVSSQRRASLHRTRHAGLKGMT